MKLNKEYSKTHIGKVLDAHGIRGDIYCIVFSGDASWIPKIKSINLRSELNKKLSEQDIQILKIKAFKKGFLATLEGIDNRNKAEEYKGAEVWIDSSVFISKDGESLYLSELLKFNVEDKTLGKIGCVVSFSTNNSQDLLVVSNENKTFEVPFVKELVINIDYINKVIFMNLPEGLLEINEPDKHE